MKGFIINLEEKTLENDNFREVLFTTDKSQLVVMSLEPKEEIGMETHAEHDQFIRVEKGEGKAILNSEEFPLKDGSAVVIPAGTEHNIVNISDSEKMKLYTVYTPPEHPDGTINRNKQEAEECEKRNSSLS
ncbi:MAG: cupin [Candidatus Liptonbacteria bacterium RIFOXYC1_FULL_36_8]|uniref:Cupin n=3 Tax=Candidatus Liptoniibacteriota TaxID=1817909 RepID=A0A1G2CP63_9BACT|nr:MAG: cupin [Candidatus Liptonbacteria bacterium RIFOXYB1_FULL_36_10]OGZ03175.1 MAG: cupin [Candidatus Liptonbacteria bacterium RIFOXYD1_FULL_36_11]OGZ03357.1 MAG: cupin [Candidatus Liptonbacteria bacterium RIFOXYC1_FULL_36_8]